MATTRNRRIGSRERILDAAETLVREQGANRMTLDAVAAQAGLSKGGLLYNFPSKAALLRGMMARLMERLIQPQDEFNFAEILDRRLERQDSPLPHTGHGMLAAVAEDSGLLDPVRSAQTAIWTHLQALGRNADSTLIAWLAAEGLSFLELFDISPLTPEERARVVRAIRDLPAKLAR